MANTKISALTAGDPAQTTDEVPIARSGANYRLSVSSIANLPTSINAQTGTSYTIQDTDTVVTFTNAADILVALPQAGTGNFISGWHCVLKNLNSAAGTVILTPTTSTVSLAAQVVIPPGSAITIWSDGTNYFADDAESSFMIGPDCVLAVAINTNAGALVTAGDEVWTTQFIMKSNRVISQVTYSAVVAGAGGSTITLGLYTLLGSKIISSGTFDGSSVAAQTKTFTKTLFVRGVYNYVSTASTQTTLTGSLLVNTNTGRFWLVSTQAYFQTVSTKAGTAANSATSGVLPATLGAITAVQNAHIPAAMWE